MGALFFGGLFCIFLKVCQICPRIKLYKIMKTIDEQYARLEKLLDDEKIYLVRGVSFADLCVALGADRQAMDDHLQKELGMDGEALMQTFRQRDMERWEQRFGIRVEIY